VEEWEVKRIKVAERSWVPIAITVACILFATVVGLFLLVRTDQQATGEVSGSFRVIHWSGGYGMNKLAAEPNTSSPIDVRVVGEGGYNEMVVLSAENLPDGVTVSFNPSSGIPTFDSDMTLTYYPTAPEGRHTIILKATGADGKVSTTTFLIEVLPTWIPPELS
jgi:hypothetical protein